MKKRNPNFLFYFSSQFRGVIEFYPWTFKPTHRSPHATSELKVPVAVRTKKKLSNIKMLYFWHIFCLSKLINGS
jgi:hypothetical protein